ncbi:MAG: CBS domain-containing protein [Rhizobiaceae bacterium]
MSVTELLKSKGNRLVSIPPDFTVAQVASLLRNERIGAALVKNDNTILGIISERDIVFGLDKHGQSVTEMTCSELMSSPVQTCTTETPTEDLMKQMLSKKIRHIPVVEKNELLGIVSIGDVVNSVVAELERTKDILEQQIIRSAAWATDED